MTVADLRPRVPEHVTLTLPGAVLREPLTRSELQVLLQLAYRAHPESGAVAITPTRLAAYTGLTRVGVHVALRSLRARGLVARDDLIAPSPHGGLRVQCSYRVL